MTILSAAAPRPGEAEQPDEGPGVTPVRMRFVLALLALVALCQAVVPALGFYSDAGLGWALAALAFALLACARPGRDVSLPGRWQGALLSATLLGLGVQAAVLAVLESDGWDLAVALLALPAAVAAWFVPLRSRSTAAVLLAAAALLLTGQGVLFAELLYAENEPAVVVMRGASLAGFLVTASLLLELPSFPGVGRGFGVRVLLLFVSGAVLRGSVIFASPDPLIDVFRLLQEAPVHLLHGHNPYAADYSSPYGTERAREYHIVEQPESRPAAYPPLPTLLALPFRASGLDARWANVGCDLLAALVLLLAARPPTGVLLAAIYLHFPRAPFLIEQSWYEPMLAALFGGGLLLAQRGRRGGYGLLALALTGKQFGAVLLPSLWRARRREWPLLCTALALVLLLVFLPFFLAGPHDFVGIVLLKHLRRPPAYGSLTVQSACHWLFHVDLPRGATLGVALLLIAWVAWKTPRQGVGAGLWLGTALVVFCLGHTQGFFNYYYLCAYLWLLGLAGLAGEGEDEESVFAGQVSNLTNT